MGKDLQDIIYAKYKIEADSLKIVEIDDEFTRLLGYTKEDVAQGNLTLQSIMFDSDWEEYIAKVTIQRTQKHEAYIGHRVKNKNGESIFVYCFGKDVYDAEQDKTYCDIMITQLTSQQVLHQQLADSRILLRDVLNSLVGGVGIFEIDGMKFKPQYLSDGFYDLFGIHSDKEEQFNGDFSQLIYGEDILKVFDDVKVCISSKQSTHGEYRFIKLDGGFRWMQVQFSLLESEEEALPRVSAFFFDITKTKQEQLQLKAQNKELYIKSELDALTGIYNRNAFIRQVNAYKKDVTAPKNMALLMIDVDDFKNINDMLGHYKGDQVLKETARRLNEMSLNVGIAGRMGGDEFAVFLYDISDRDMVLSFADDLCKNLAKIDLPMGFSVSVGISILEISSHVFQDYYVEADQALYVAKRKGKNQYSLFEKTTRNQKKDKSHVDSYLAEAGWFLDDMRDKIYLANPDSYELLFMNEIFKEEYGLESGDDSYRGKKCYEFLYGLNKPCDFCKNDCLCQGQNYIWNYKNPRNNRQYLCKDNLVYWHGQKAKMEIAVDMTDMDNIKEYLAARFDMEDTLRYCILNIVGNTDLKKGYRRALDFLGNYYGADRALVIFYQDYGEWEAHEWHGERVVPFLDKNGELRQEYDIKKHLDFYNEGIPTLLDDVEKIDSFSEEHLEFLHKFHIWSYYALPLRHEEEIYGMLMVFNPKKHLGDLNLLHLLSVFLANEVIKRNMWQHREYEITHDKLTGLCNRTSYMQYVRSLRDKTSIGLIVADINDLKKVNEKYGFDYGNMVVKRFAEVLQEVFPNDRVFRFDGDDFAVCCEDISYSDFIGKISTLKEILQNSICPASLGCSWDNYEMDLQKMISNADEALDLEKKRQHDDLSRRDQYLKDYTIGFSEEMLRNKRYLLYLQPKVDLKENRLIGAEALVRLDHPKDGILTPGKFIPQLESSGGIAQVDLYIFELVCAQLALWKKKKKKLIKISFNFSRITLLDENLIEKMEKIIQKYKVDKKYLEVEITETVGDLENQLLEQIANQLHQHGFQLAMDDFGTKYSNVSIISLMRFNVLKIDRSMIYNIEKNETDRTVLKHVVAMCKDIGVACIAEGVETEKQRDLLMELGCEYGQGYLYSKPISVDDFSEKYDLR